MGRERYTDATAVSLLDAIARFARQSSPLVALFPGTVRSRLSDRGRRNSTGRGRAIPRGSACIALVLSACQTHEPARIGIVVSNDAVVAAEIAVRQVNASGGIQGRPLALRVVTGAGSTRAGLALSAAEQLAGDQSVFGIVGHTNSSASLSAAQIYNARQVVQIAPTSSTPLLSLVGPYTFRLVPSDIHQARFLANEVIAENARPRTALYFVNDDYGHALHEELRTRLQRERVPIVFDSPYDHEEDLPNARVLASRIAEGQAELLIWIGRSRQLQQLLPDLRQALPGIRILASDGVDEGLSRHNVGGILTGVRFVRLIDPDATLPPLVDLRQSFAAAAPGVPLTAEAALTYDAVMLLATSARVVGTRRDSVRDYLAGLGTRHAAYEGATGAIRFDENGDPQASYCLAEIGASGIRILPRGPIL